MTDHRKHITSARRRNNIYGELSDFIAIPFLNMGGEGLIYNPTPSDDAPITIYGRSKTKLYLIKVVYRQDPSSPAELDAETRLKLVEIAAKLGAVPLYAVACNSTKHTRYYNAVTRAKMYSMP